MTTTHAAAQAELTHAGRDLSQAEQDAWLRSATYKLRQMGQRTPPPFEPRRLILNPLAAQLLKASNAIHLYKRILP